MNIPNFDKSKKQQEIPPEAQGNPVYEQTRQDMPLWCCGRNCGRNTRIVVLVLTMIGIGCSMWACLSAKYFSFVALRNDTFTDPEKAQPEPFEYATEANVGLFKYEILDVFVYPWPPKGERMLFDELLMDELRRMQEVDAGNNLTDSTGLPFGNFENFTDYTDVTDLGGGNSTDAPATDGRDCDGLAPRPGSVACDASVSPTTQPTMAPTPINPNDVIAETVDIGVVKPYPDGIGMFNSAFTRAQKGAIMGPVFAVLGVVFAMIELCCCTYRCSWLPPALFLYLAFMFQLFTVFLFLSEDWCKYDQECALGNAGYASVMAIICYMFAQNLICCAPRPQPYYNMCPKKSPPRKKKKKRMDGEEDDEEAERLNRAWDDPDYDDGDDDFRDEPGNGYVDPYDNATADDYDYGGDSYMEPSTRSGQGNEGNESYNYDSAYDDGTYDDGTYEEGAYDDGTYDDGTYDDGTYDNGTHGDDDNDGTYDNGTYGDDDNEGAYDDKEDGGDSYYTEGDDGTNYDSNYDDGQNSKDRY